jgi:spermidine/putrescine transport system permease protein
MASMAKRSFDIQAQPGFGLIALLTFVGLYLPIAALVAYSFNAADSLSRWDGFSLRWFISAWHNSAVQDASVRSLVLAVSAAALSTIVATMAALATTRTRPYPGLTFKYAFINQPLMVPEIVTGVALLIVFSRMDLTLERAAADLYATPWQAFRFVTLPLLRPAIIAGFMLAFVISLDDVVITEFVKSGGQDTLPTYMLGQLRRETSPEINAIATVFLALSVVLVTVFYFVNRRKP